MLIRLSAMTPSPTQRCLPSSPRGSDRDSTINGSILLHHPTRVGYLGAVRLRDRSVLVLSRDGEI